MHRTRGTRVVHKRPLLDIWLNNYQPYFTLSWDANHDVQLCFDVHSVIGYISNYVSKPETVASKALLDYYEQIKDDDLSATQQMYRLAQKYLMSRTISEAEAYYKFDPTLTYKQSNLKTLFIHAGFPHNKQRFLNKCQTDEEIAQGFLVEGHEGHFKEIASRYERYLCRPTSLEFITYFQFMQYYDLINPERKHHYVKLIDTLDENNLKPIIMDSDNLEYCLKFRENKYLPQVISITVNEKTQLYRLRRVPCIIRMKTYSIVCETHEFYFSELTKFRPHRSENELFHKSDSFEQCEELFFSENKSKLSLENNTFGVSKIDDVKSQLLPNYEKSEKLREIIQTLNKDLALDDVNDQLEPELDLIDSDDENSCIDSLQGLEPGPEHLTPDENKTRVPFFHCITVKDRKSLINSATQLSYDQFIAFNEIINYCFKLKVSRKNTSISKPKPPKLIIEGGAGTGKSFTINTIRDWINYLLFSPGDNIDQPYLLVTAPTGMAATNIGGSTIHSTLKFGYGNDYKRLSDKTRDKVIDAYKNVQFIIIDECSMISSDMLYNISRRMSEIKCCDDFFGGCAVILLGDFLQLRPIDNNYLFHPPNSKKLKNFFAQFPLLRTFTVVCLRQNFRQNADNEFLDLLNEVRMKGKFDHLSSKNSDLLLSRVLPLPPDTHAAKIYAKNVTCNKENTLQLNLLPGETFKTQATFIPESYNPVVKDAGTIDDTPFVNVFEFKVGARVILKYNLNLNDKLVNGSQGTIFKILTLRDTVNLVLVKFDDPKAGIEQRRKYLFLDDVRKNVQVTPISKIEFQYFVPRLRKNICLIQFPLKLSFAITSHSAQGMTIPYPTKLQTSFKDMFEGGMGYVILSRLQRLDQLYLTPFPMKKLYCSEEAKNFTQNLYAVAKNLNYTIWSSDSFFKVASVNVQNFKVHVQSLKAYHDFEGLDLLCLQETWLESDMDCQWENCTMIQLNHHARGIAIVFKNDYKPYDVIKMKTPFANLIIAIYATHIIINVYQFVGASNLSDFFKTIEFCEKYAIPILIMGDFNVNLLKQKHAAYVQQLQKFTQHVKQPTHTEGGLIDHVYSSLFESSDSSCKLVNQTYGYFTDHTIQFVELKRK